MEQLELFSEKDFKMYQPMLFDLETMPGADSYKGEKIVQVIVKKSKEANLPLVYED